MTTFAATRIFTDDMDGMLAFYERVTGVTANRIHPLFAQLETPSGILAISSTRTLPAMGENVGEPRANRSIALDFLVDDVDASYAELQGYVTTFLNEPSNMPWGNRSLLFRDPDGNLINFFARLDPSAAASVELP